MKNICRTKSAGFTLLELLLVITIIAILFALIFPVIHKARQRSRQAACMSNLKQISIGFVVFKQDHDERLPAAVPIAEGGAKEFFFGPAANLLPGWHSNTYRIYQAMSNTLSSPKIVICPSDRWSRAADTFADMKPSAYWHHPNVSYSALVSFPGRGEGSGVIWGGDASEDERIKEYLAFFAGPDERAALLLWSNHGYSRGNLLFGDARVESWGIENSRGSWAGIPVLLATTPSQTPSPGPGQPPPPNTGTGNATARNDSPGTQEQPASGSSPSARPRSNPGRPSSNPGSSAASSGSSSSGGTLQRLENFFGGKPGGQVRASTGSAVPSTMTNIFSAATAAPPAMSISSNSIPARTPLLITNAPLPAVVEPLIKPEQVLETIARKSSQIIYWLLLLLMLTAVAISIQRRWQRGAQKKDAEQEAF